MTNTTPSFDGRVILVTGAASGIGAAAARLLAGVGASVVLGDIDRAAVERVAAGICADGGTALAARLDVAQPEDCLRLVDLAVDVFGVLHGAVNNAGVAASGAYLADEAPDVWERVVSINLSGVFYGMQAQIPQILAAGGGAIVNLSSMAGIVATRGSSAYTAAKHGVVGLTKVAALEYADRCLRINVIGPGMVETPLLERRFSAPERARGRGMHPLGRGAAPDGIAGLIAFLLSDSASFVTGSFYPIDGGYTTA